MNIEFDDRQITFVPWCPELGTVFSTPYAFDSETTPIDDHQKWRTPLYVLGAATDGHKGYFILPEHVEAFFLAHSHLTVVMHNATFDLAVVDKLLLRKPDIYDLVDSNRVHDTQILHRLLVLATEGHVARAKGQSGLAACTKRYLGVELPKDLVDGEETDVRTGFDRWLNAPPQEIEPIYLEYLAKDALATIGIYPVLVEQLAEALYARQDAFGYISESWLEEQIERWGLGTHDLHVKAAIVLEKVTVNGLRFDAADVTREIADLEQDKAESLGVLRSHGYLPGEEGCNKSLGANLERFEKRSGLRLERTEAGRIKTATETLQDFRDLDPFIDDYLDYKDADRLCTYMKKVAGSGVGLHVAHASFFPLLNSGRTSSSGEINAQNLPPRMRACVRPTPGGTFVIADYSQLELATLAQTIKHHTGELGEMGRRINQGEDLHRLVAAKVLGKEPSDVTGEERQKAKAINFAKPGGMSTNGLIRTAKSGYGVILSEEEAQGFEAGFFELFPEIQGYLDQRLDSGIELATLLDLTPQNYFEETGRRISSDDGEDQPCGILGSMCLKAVAEEAPQTRKGEPYTANQIEFFWDRLTSAKEMFPEKVQRLIESRKPSWKLRKAIWHELGKGPVFTASGRLRAAASYCAQKNAGFQGLAADGAKLALWRLYRAGYRIVNFIHDEFVIEVPDDENAEAKKEDICRIMVESMKEFVPDVEIRVEAVVSNRWEKGSTPAAVKTPVSESSDPTDVISVPA